MKTMFELPLLVLVAASTIVFLQWDFLFYGVAALGLNFTVATGLFLACWLRLQYNVKGPTFFNGFSKTKAVIWLLPPVLVALSFSIYENTWLKLISIGLLPLMLGSAIICSQAIESDRSVWGIEFIVRLSRRILSPLRFLNSALVILLEGLLPQKAKANGEFFRQVIMGVGVLVPLASVAIFLLGDVDQAFFRALDSLVSKIISIFNSSLWLKILATFIVSVVMIGLLLGWSQTPLTVLVNGPRTKHNLIAISIVILGLNVIYLVFLTVQAEALFINNLPKNLLRAQKLVKSGFWQLFSLSIINTCLFLFTQRKELGHAKWLVHIFVISSTLLVLSACWRLGLYVYLYGLSHEKFFASYTALFSVITFALLIKASFSKNRQNLLKSILILSTWFYAIATLTPIENFTFKTNVWLSQRADSRVDLYHLSLMSVDVKNRVEAAIEDELFSYDQWQWWLAEKEENYCNKQWYTFNVSRALNCKKNSEE